MLRRTTLAIALALAAPALFLSCGGGGGGGSQAFSVSPSSFTITTWDKRQFTASAPAYWDVVEPGGGFFDGADGVYTASYQPGTYHVIARQQSDQSRTATATVKVVAPPSAALTCPLVVNHGARGVQASVGVQSGTTYTWTVQGAASFTGQSTAAIAFDAPESGTVVLTCQVRNEAGKVDSQTRSIPVAPAPAITSFAATPAAILGGQGTQLVATFTGATAQVDGLGPIQSGVGVVVSPVVSTSYTLRVANQAGEETISQCSVTVTPVVISPDPTPVVVAGGIIPLTASVLGSLDQSLAWEAVEAGTGGVLGNTGGAWTYQAPNAPGTYHLVARSAAFPAAQTTVTVTAFEPFSAFRAGGYPVSPYLDSAAQPTAFGWARHSRFTGPRSAAGPQAVWSLATGSSYTELLLGPRGEFYTAAGKKWDAYGKPVPAFHPTNTYDLTAPMALDRQGRLLAFDYLWPDGIARLCALDAESGALGWSAPIAWEGAVSCRLTLGEDGRMVGWNNWNGASGNTLVVLSSEGAVLWTKALPQYGEALFCPDGGLIHVGYQEIVKWDTDGNEVWRLAETVSLTSLYNGLHPRAVVGADGTLYLCSGDSYGVTAVSATGAVRWRYPFGTAGSEAYLALAKDGTVLCGLQDSPTPLVALDASGQLKWKYTLASGQASLGEPLVDRDGYVYVASRAPWPATNGKLLAFTPTGAPLWSLDLPLGYYGTPRLTLGPRSQLLVTWNEATWALEDPQP